MSTATKPALILPDVLNSYRESIEKALTVPMPVVWDEEGPGYIDAEQPKAIAKALIPALHGQLRGARIGYLFREKMRTHDRETLGKASKVGGKLEHFSELDFLMEINFDAWRFLDARARVALIDHELSHFARDQDGGCVILSHDVEEFGSIVNRWGLWKLDLKRFGETVVRTTQRDLFGDNAASDPQAVLKDVTEKVIDQAQAFVDEHGAGDGDTKVTLSHGGRSVTMTDKQFSAMAAAKVNGNGKHAAKSSRVDSVQMGAD